VLAAATRTAAASAARTRLPGRRFIPGR
jgi:hypothetical protein